ncbi:MAG: hypothetical protein ACI8PB_000041 [Desulforhopalus sp.]|jgi:hypothetical protein
MIFQMEPEDWKALQSRTAMMFTEIGCESEVEKTIETVRGTVEIDVFVKDLSSVPPLTVLCECKYWNKRIPKNVVHAFRTVVSDFGANTGFIISKLGFQSGAIEATEKSNIILVDWTEFQTMFYDRWVQSMRERMFKYADEIFEYMDVLDDRMSAIDWNQSNSDMHMGLMRRSIIYINANQWSGRVRPQFDFPLRIQDPRKAEKIEIRINNYREYYDLCFSSAPALIKSWRVFFGNINPNEKL